MTTPAHTSRRARREAAREIHRTEPRRRSPQRSGPGIGIGRLTLVAVAAGIAIVAIVILAQGTPTAPGADLDEPIIRTNMSLADGRSLGEADAPVQVDLWSDFQCPSCGLFATTVEPVLEREFVATGRARLTYRDRAFLGGGGPNDESVLAAAAARCGGEQDRFWPYHDWLFANQQGENRGAFSRDRLVAIADAVGLDRPAFEACLDGSAARDAVAAENAEGVAAGITATPSLVINGETFEGTPTIEQLRAIIEAAAGPSASPGGGG
jgi:protein-disulfide isomerase